MLNMQLPTESSLYEWHLTVTESFISIPNQNLVGHCENVDNEINEKNRMIKKFFIIFLKS